MEKKKNSCGLFCFCVYRPSRGLNFSSSYPSALKFRDKWAVFVLFCHGIRCNYSIQIMVQFIWPVLGSEILEQMTHKNLKPNFFPGQKNIGLNCTFTSALEEVAEARLLHMNL